MHEAALRVPAARPLAPGHPCGQRGRMDFTPLQGWISSPAQSRAGARATTLPGSCLGIQSTWGTRASLGDTWSPKSVPPHRPINLCVRNHLKRAGEFWDVRGELKDLDKHIGRQFLCRGRSSCGNDSWGWGTSGCLAEEHVPCF